MKRLILTTLTAALLGASAAASADDLSIGFATRCRRWTRS